MLAALAVVIPLGLGGAVSPVMLTEQTMLLAGPGGRAGARYAAGVVVTTFVIVVGIVLFGRAISLPTKPHLDETLDLVLGLVLVTWLFSFRLGTAPGRVAESRGRGRPPAGEWFTPGASGVSVRRVRPLAGGRLGMDGSDPEPGHIWPEAGASRANMGA